MDVDIERTPPKYLSYFSVVTQFTVAIFNRIWLNHIRNCIILSSILLQLKKTNKKKNKNKKTSQHILQQIDSKDAFSVPAISSSDAGISCMR